MSVKIIKSSAGDTIVEVLIAIAIAGLALGICYATASKSMQRSISARERDQAVGIMESQLASMKAVEQNIGLTNFDNQFTSGAYPHFCFYYQSAANPNAYQKNHGTITTNSTLKTVAPNPYYDPKCTQSGYFIDIQTVAVAGKYPRYNYQVNVRWLPLGGMSNNQVTVYYRF